MTWPFAREAITVPREANDIADPMLAVLAMLNADQAEPIDPIDAKLPTDRIDSVEPLLAIDRNESSEAMDHRDGMLPWWSTLSHHARGRAQRGASSGATESRAISRAAFHVAGSSRT